MGLPVTKHTDPLNERAQPIGKPDDILGQLGVMEVRLARTPAEVNAALALRHDVFFAELGATRADVSTPCEAGIDRDDFDGICDHLIVLDKSVPLEGRKRGNVVATYRLLRQEVADANSGFYSAGEFDIAPLIAAHRDKRFLELGRSCVLAEYRNKRTIELLWQGTWAYILKHKMDVLFGCASLSGTDPEKLKVPLSFLHHSAVGKDEWAVSPLPELAADLTLLNEDEVDMRMALRSLPPLIKGYLRLGARVSDGAMIDYAFGTTDVMIVLPVAEINPAYVNYYGADASRHAAH
jgi:putative hemolysin